MSEEEEKIKLSDLLRDLNSANWRLLGDTLDPATALLLAVGLAVLAAQLLNLTGGPP